MFELTVSHIDNLINTNKFSWKDLEKLIEMREKLSKNNNELYKDQEMTNLLKTLIEFFQKWENSIDWWYKIEENTSWTWQIFNLWNKEDLQSFKKLSLWNKFKNQFWKRIDSKHKVNKEKYENKDSKEYLWTNLFN